MAFGWGNLGDVTFGKEDESGQRGGGLLDIFGALGQGAQAGREREALLNQRQDAIREAADQNRLAAAKYNAAVPGLRANNAVRGDLLANVKSVGTTGSGRDLRFTGGLSPDLLSGQTRALGQVMGAAASGNTGAGAQMDPGRAALLQQLAGSYQPFQPQFTAPTALPQEGKASKVATTLGILGKIGGAVAPFLPFL